MRDGLSTTMVGGRRAPSVLTRRENRGGGWRLPVVPEVSQTPKLSSATIGDLSSKLIRASSSSPCRLPSRSSDTRRGNSCFSAFSPARARENVAFPQCETHNGSSPFRTFDSRLQMTVRESLINSHDSVLCDTLS